MSDPLRILVIDDSEDDRLLYRRTLQKAEDANYDIVEAEDGETGLHLMQENPPACVLLDYSLPGRDGVEVLKRIRSRHPFIPVVMLTGQGNEAVAVKAMQEGAQNYISKSAITPEALQRAIRIAIEHCSLHRRIHEQRTSLEIFTRALAHDLKEPVRTIRSFLDLIATHEKLSERGQGYFNYIQKAADRMSTLIDTVYFYTRLEDTEQSIAKEMCDVSSVIDDVKENLGELIRECSATISSDPLPVVSANRMQMIQVFQNLLCNAMRHSGDHPAIHIRAEEGEHQWLFRISDNGPGVDSEHFEKIFEPFKRMVRQKEQGLGLGLAICKKIIESHGGKIWYEANPGAGATFTFTLPKIANAQPDAAPHEVHHEASGVFIAPDDKKLGTIMLVEDNEADVELTRIMLIEEAHLKCSLLVSCDGNEALNKLHDIVRNGGEVDLLLLDINMPGMDGFDLLKRLREDPELKHIPVVMCTTSTYDKDMERAKELGAAGYITKPAEIGKLRTILDRTPSLRLSHDDDDGYSLRRAS